jgi:hypothetical protein
MRERPYTLLSCCVSKTAASIRANAVATGTTMAAPQ